MMTKCLIPIFLALLVYVSAQTSGNSTSTSSTAAPTSSSTASSAKASPTSLSSTTESSSTSTNSTSTSTESSSTSTTETPTSPAINTCQKPGRFPATTGKCIQEYIVCIPNFKGGFWQHNWKCAGSLVYNDKYKKCTAPRKADCATTTS